MTYAGHGWTHLENTHYHFFAPRVGFAWTPKPNWSIRGGYGIFSILWSQAITPTPTMSRKVGG